MKVEILSKDYEFRELESFDGADMGRSNSKRLEIFIVKNMPKQSKEETLLHEIIHMVGDSCGLDLEENIVKALAAGLYTCSAVKVLYPKKDK